MKRLRDRKWFVRLVVIFMLLILTWTGFYAYRSYHGSYHEVVYEGGVSYALWFPTDFEPRGLAPPRPEGQVQVGRGRFAPMTRLPKVSEADWPLLILDRWIFHEPIQTVSGQGDMPRLFELSPDGRSLVPVSAKD